MRYDRGSMEPALRWLVSQAAHGHCVLFLGAGASLSSKTPTGEPAPGGAELARRISEHFLGEYDGWPLATAADYCIGVAGRTDVELFIRQQLADLIPSDTMRALPEVPWRTIYTTNFDTLVEDSYRLAGNTPRIRPIFTTLTPVRDLSPSEIPLYKLHGCITRAGGEEGRPVLTLEDSVQIHQQRGRLFRRLMEDMAEYTILYLGYSREDPDFQATVSQLASEMNGIHNLPSSYGLQPGNKEYQRIYWQSKKVHLIDEEADQFIPWLITEIAKLGVAPSSEGPPPISLFAGVEITNDTTTALHNHFEFPKDEAPKGAPEFTSFFKGSRPFWGQLAAACDAQRDVTDEIVLESIESGSRDGPNLILILAEAGAGKTTILRRVGLDLATVWGLPVFSLRERAALEFDLLANASRLIGQRLIVLVDDGADRAAEVADFMERATSSRLPVTLIAAARTNEWKARTAELAIPKTSEFEVRHLSSEEIDRVLAKLEEFNELGELAGLSTGERTDRFRLAAERQLLVALREATEGKRFDEIVRDEYDRIPTDEAKKAYLYISALYQVRVPLRAGVLRRLLDLPFDQFTDRLVAPAQGVIIEDEDPQGLAYRARHPVIAQIVVNYLLPSAQDKLAMYTTIVNALDLGYEEDATAFARISRNRQLVDDLGLYDLKAAFYQACHETNPKDALVLHHWAIAAMDVGRFGVAEDLLNRARDMYPRDLSIQHGLGMLAFRRFENEAQGSWASLHFDRAQQAFERMIRRAPGRAVAYDSLARLFIRKGELSPSDDLVAWYGRAEEVIADGILHATEKTELYALRGSLQAKSGQLAEAEKTFNASLQQRPDQPGVRRLYVHLLLDQSRLEDAIKVAEVGTRRDSLDPKSHHLHAIALAAANRPFDQVTAQFHLATEPRSSQYLGGVDYAAYLMLHGHDEEARAEFDQLANLEIERREKTRPRRPAFAPVDSLQFRGRIVKIVDHPWRRFGFIQLAGHSLDVFFDYTRVAHVVRENDEVDFNLRFNCHGPVALDVRPAG